MGAPLPGKGACIVEQIARFVQELQRSPYRGPSTPSWKLSSFQEGVS